jgi:hypothetical protein
MIRVNIEVRDGQAGFAVPVQAESISQALRIADGLFPGGEARVVFPIEPEGFFVDGGASGPIEVASLGRTA